MTQLDPPNVALLRRRFADRPNVHVVHADFLTWEYPDPFPLVVMNPPFSTPGKPDAYMEHIERAFGFLGRDGYLVSVTPTGWLWKTNTALARAFRLFASRRMHSWEVLPPKSFAESGTGTETVVLQLARWDDAPSHGYPNHRVADAVLTFQCDAKLYEDLSKVAEHHAATDLLGDLMPWAKKRISKALTAACERNLRDQQKRGAASSLIVSDGPDWPHVLAAFHREVLEQVEYLARAKESAHVHACAA